MNSRHTEFAPRVRFSMQNVFHLAVKNTKLHKKTLGGRVPHHGQATALQRKIDSEHNSTAPDSVFLSSPRDFSHKSLTVRDQIRAFFFFPTPTERFLSVHSESVIIRPKSVHRTIFGAFCVFRYGANVLGHSTPVNSVRSSHRRRLNETRVVYSLSFVFFFFFFPPTTAKFVREIPGQNVRRSVCNVLE